jgi:hypothetical protein
MCCVSWSAALEERERACGKTSGVTRTLATNRVLFRYPIGSTMHDNKLASYVSNSKRLELGNSSEPMLSALSHPSDALAAPK